MLLKSTLLFTLVAMAMAGDTDWHAPEQIHIAIGENPDEMFVVWTTFNDTADSTVQYGQAGWNMKATGQSTKFTDHGDEQRFWWIHKVVLKQLTADTNYTYQVGSDSNGYSKEFSFRTWPLEHWQPSIILYGDLGLTNAQSMDTLTKDINSGKYDAIIHAGDFAYDMDSYNSRTGDQFMNMIQPIAATVPYMTAPGNHESEGGHFYNYKARFPMPRDDDQNMFFSFNVGTIHFISMNTEAWYNYDNAKNVAAMYSFMEADLKEATKPENRANQPWIIVFGHRPMYCSNANSDDCTHTTSETRGGIPSQNIPGVEKLFYQYGVDVEIWAHEHSYERLWPVYDGKVYNGSANAPYTNPGAPVHIITGNAGCREIHDHFPDEVTSKLSAFHSDDYGYLRMKAYNSSHLYMEELSIDKNDVLDKVWIIKDKHLPYGF